MLQFHPSAAADKCSNKTPRTPRTPRMESAFEAAEIRSARYPKKASMDQQKEPLARHEGNVDVELCHIVAFATKADLQVKKLDDKQVHVHFERPGCFCGSMTLTMSVKLICILELALISILILQAPELLQKTTNHFYVTDTTFTDHYVSIFVFEMFILLSCLGSILMLFYAILRMRAVFVLPHLAWQVFYAFCSTIVCTAVLIMASFGIIMWPSAVVLVILVGLPAVLEVWWLYTVVDFYRQVLINERINNRLRKDSQEPLRNIFANGLLHFHNNSDVRKESGALP